RRLPRHIRDRPQDHAGEIAWTDLGESESPRDMDGYAGHGSDADEGKAELTDSSASESDAEASGDKKGKGRDHDVVSDCERGGTASRDSARHEPCSRPELVELSPLPTQRLSRRSAKPVRHCGTDDRVTGESNSNPIGDQPAVHVDVLTDGAVIPGVAGEDLLTETHAVPVKTR